MTEGKAGRWKSFAALSLLLSGSAVLTFIFGADIIVSGEAPTDSVQGQIFLTEHLSEFRIVYGVFFAMGAAALIAAVIQLFRFRQAPILAVIALLVAIPVTLMGGWMNYVMGRVAGSNEQVAGWNGVTAPDMSFNIVDGESFRLSDLRGTRVLINHWATWCLPCRAELPGLIEIVEETSRDNVMLIGMSIEEANVVRKGAAELGINYPLAVLSREEFDALAGPFNIVPFLPTSFLIDRNGVIQKIHIGVVTHDDLVEMLLEGHDYQGAPKAPPV